MPAIGIDFGSRYICAATWVRGRITVISNYHGYKLTPCIVSFHDGRIIVGNGAEDLIITNTKNTIIDIKYILGCKFDDPSVIEFMRGRLFQIVNDNGIPKIKIDHENGTQLYTTEEIVHLIIAQVKEMAQSYLGCEISEAVITVPVNFTEIQRTALISSCRMAQLEVLQIINEPTAAALAYGLNNCVAQQRTVLVLDVGYYSSQVCILRINSESVFELGSNVKQSYLGAFDIQNRILGHVSNRFKFTYLNAKIDLVTFEKMRLASEMAMRTLTKSNIATIEITNLQDGMDFSMTIQRSEFEKLCDDLLKKLFIPIQRALIEAHTDKNNIDNLIFVGGSTRVPKIKNMIKKFFSNPNTTLNNYINPNVVIAYGAALQAAILKNELNVKESHNESNLLSVPGECFSENISESRSAIMVNNLSSTILENRSLSNLAIPALGIAVGNSISCAAIFIQGTIEMIVNDHGNRIMPALVHITDEENLIGESAQVHMKKNPQNTISSLKQLLSATCYQQTENRYPFEMINDAGKPKIVVELQGMTKVFAPEEIFFMIVEKLKQHAEAYLGRCVNKAILAVPLSYSEEIKQTIVQGCKKIDLNIVEIVLECNAAILAYRLEKRIPKTFRKVFTLDLGLHALELTVITVKPGSEFEVISHMNTSDVRGKDFNQRLFFYLADELKVKYGLKIETDLQAVDRLLKAVERAKITLSTSTMASIVLDNLFKGFDFYTGITRQTFEAICKPLFDSMIVPIETVLLRANIKKTDINDIILIGGNSFIPRIRTILRELLGNKSIHCTIHPVEVVAHGAAVQGAYLNGDTVYDEFIECKKKSNTSVPAKRLSNILLPITGAIESVGGAVKSLQTIVLGKN